MQYLNTHHSARAVSPLCVALRSLGALM